MHRNISFSSVIFALAIICSQIYMGLSDHAQPIEELKLIFNFIDISFVASLVALLFSYLLERRVDLFSSVRNRFSKRLSRSADASRRSFLVDMLLPIDRSKDLHANLDEVEPLWVAAHGIKRARWIRRSQEMQAIAKYWASPLKDAFRAVLKVIR